MYKELTWRVVSKRYNTTKIIVVQQKSEKDNSFTQNYMVFGNINTNRIEVRVNGYKCPQEDFKCDISEANEIYPNAY